MTDLELSAAARQAIEASIETKRRVADQHLDAIVRIARAAAECFKSGGKILFCGNGGSAADAQHLAAEFLVRLRSHVNRPPLPAIALALDTSSLTACGNDFGFEVYYERMVQGLGCPGDILVALSTSGKSPNIVRALKAARERKLQTIGLLGGSGMPALADCDLAVVVPSADTARVQECHIMIGHVVALLAEDLVMEG